jgi:hypothetical protein
MDKFIDAVRLMFPRVPFDAVLSTGRSCTRSSTCCCASKAKGLPIHVTRHGQDNIRLLRSADLVISMAGYNTISEILRYRKRAIVVPRSGPSAEQTIRTGSWRSAACSRWCWRASSPRRASPPDPPQAREPCRSTARDPGMDGAANAAERLLAANG